MNAGRRTELRTYQDLQAQIRLERMLAMRHAADAARAQRFAERRKPISQPAKATRTARLSRKQLAGAVAIWAIFFAFALWLAAHDPHYLSQLMECVIDPSAELPA